MVQPGPVSPDRIESGIGSSRSAGFRLEAGLNLRDAVAGPLQRAGIASAGVTLTNVRFAPFRFVIPAYSPDDEHAAYYSETFAPEQAVDVDVASITFGRRADGPFLHCHALWRDPAGQRRGGHVLPLEAVVASPGQAAAFGTDQVDMVSEFDPETNFSLFRPRQVAPPAPGEACLVARIRPNEDLVESIEALCRRHEVVSCAVRSGIGSTVGMAFDDGRTIEDRPTEILVLEGRVERGCAELRLAVIDVRGDVHEGRPARGCNPVLICFELVLQPL